MNRILADASLPGVQKLFAPLEVTLYTDHANLVELLPHHDILLCRSTLNVNAQLLAHTSIKLVATASSGSDHLDLTWLRAHNIPFFAAQGCNAHAVADYVCIVLAWLQKNRNWWGKTAGIIGCGKVGTEVKVRLESLGFRVCTYDPWRMDERGFEHCSLQDLQQSDLLCLHTEYHHRQPYPSHHLIDSNFLRHCNPDAILLNAARGNIVEEEALLKSEICRHYCTDVFSNEPNLNLFLLRKCLLATPHIAGHSIEAKYNALVIIARKIFEYLEFTPVHSLAEQKYPYHTVNPANPKWIDAVLSFYNPESDSIALKTSPDIAKTFTQRRKAHNFRHDLHWCFGQ